MKRWLIVIPQIVLLGVELFTHYDTGVRQGALAVTNIVTLGAVLLIDAWLRRQGKGLSIGTIALVFGAVWLDALGNFQHMYAGFWWWDRVTHTIGGMALSAGFIDLFMTLQRGGRWTGTWRTAIWFGFFSGQLLGSLYEISEWLGDVWFHTQRVVYTYDTPHDLFQNLVGGVIVLVVFLWTKKAALLKP